MRCSSTPFFPSKRFMSHCTYWWITGEFKELKTSSSAVQSSLSSVRYGKKRPCHSGSPSVCSQGLSSFDRLNGFVRQPQLRRTDCRQAKWRYHGNGTQVTSFVQRFEAESIAAIPEINNSYLSVPTRQHTRGVKICRSDAF